MPIYDYQCSSCGHKAELMRKVSEAVSTTCPQCGQASFEKQVSAPNFQLNGTGWYASDFKGSSPAKKTEEAAPASCGTGCACH